MRTRRSGNVVMNPRATSVMALRPTAGAPPFTLSEPFGEKKVATLVGSLLHHAAVYRWANSRRFDCSEITRLFRVAFFHQRVFTYATTSLICPGSSVSFMPGIWESPFSIHVFRDSVVTLLPFTVNVPRLERPFRPGPIFF